MGNVRKSLFQESGLPECQESCRQELEELKRVQEEQMQISIRENEEKMQRFEQKYREKRQKLTRECEKSLARQQEQNETQMALMVAKHMEQEERAARKAEELETEMEVSNNQPAVPQCPVSFSLLCSSWFGDHCADDPGVSRGDGSPHQDLPVQEWTPPL